MTALDGRYAAAFPGLTSAERHWRLLTAEEYGMPCLRIAESQAAAGAPVYRYRMTYRAPGGPFRGSTPHALDVPFTFDHVDDPAFAAFFGLTPADRPMAGLVHSAMVAFVGHSRPAAAGLPAWPRFDTAARLTMMLAAHPCLARDPDRAERLLWEA